MPSSAPLPNFLVIGAMKSGTTTLYQDLRSNPNVFMPEIKEPAGLIDDAVLTSRGSTWYKDLFRGSEHYPVRGEASTAYTMLPDIRGVPERCRVLLGQNVRLIYVVRDPVQRALSHHYHLFANGLASADVNLELRSRPEYVNYGCYARQLRPWLELYRSDRVLVLPFEAYVKQRAAHAQLLSTFLGVPERPELVEASRQFNVGERRPTGWANRVRRTRFYRRMLAPRLPETVRRVMRLALTRPAPPRPNRPNRATLGPIVERLHNESEELAALVGWESSPWDLERWLKPCETDAA